MIYKAIFLALALALIPPAFADGLVASNGIDSVRISDKPCTNQIVKNLAAQISGVAPTKLWEATATVAGRDFNACWTTNSRDVHIFYEDGDQGLIPFDDFHQVLDL